jgi:ribosomal protein S19E (S16A)
MTIEETIREQVQKMPEGNLYFPEDFSDAGTPDGIRKALQRLDSKGIIKRVAQGIYVRPKHNAYIGSVMPTAEEIAEAIARRDKARTIPTGAYALNALGLSTQIPMNIVLLTDGSPRVIKVGKRTIKFKKTTPRNLSAKGEISGLVIQALKSIGNGKVNEADEQKIMTLLRQERYENLMHDIRIAPEWMQHIMKKAFK